MDRINDNVDINTGIPTHDARKVGITKIEMSIRSQTGCGGNGVKIKLTNPGGSCETIASGRFSTGTFYVWREEQKNFRSGCNEFITDPTTTMVQVQTAGELFCPKTVTVFSKDGRIFQSLMDGTSFYG